MGKVIIVAGAPGVGKTWVCEQLKDKYNYIPHDSYNRDEYIAVITHMAEGDKHTVLAECPWNTTGLTMDLEDAGIDVEVYYIVEPETVHKARYEKRENKSILPGHVATNKRYAAREPQGRSSEILEILRKK